MYVMMRQNPVVTSLALNLSGLTLSFTGKTADQYLLDHSFRDSVA